MTKIVELAVETISIETIKPSTPTPSHLKTYSLSFLDQMLPAYHTMMLLFYPNNKTTGSPHGGISPNIKVLKDSLSETLSKYYPFAGRCIDECTVSCNDQGIPFIETRVDYVLSDFLTSSNKVDYMHKLTPPKEFMADKPLPERVPLTFQVNVFSCGGVVIGVYKLHKLLLDGTSLSAFLKHWAALTASSSGRNRDKITNPVAPDFDAVVSVFPPSPTPGLRSLADCPEYHEMVQRNQGAHVVARSFVFTKHAISVLRAKAASEEVQKPTRIEALAGFVWQHCTAAACATGAVPEGVNPSGGMSVIINMRARLKPALTSTTMGNVATLTSVSMNQKMTLAELVRAIHVAVTEKCEVIESYKKGQNIENVLWDLGARYKVGMYVLSSWCQFKLDEIDFGFGKPKWATPTDGILSPSSRNTIFFVADTDGDGIEAWLYLEEKEMQILESDQKFLAFARPN
ncbi:hypothetical protein vseg_005751 [Gypsophila vaccaria]